MPQTVNEGIWTRLAAIDGTHDCRLTRTDLQPGTGSPPRVWYVEVWDRRDHASVIKTHAPALGDALSDALNRVDRFGGAGASAGSAS